MNDNKNNIIRGAEDHRSMSDRILRVKKNLAVKHVKGGIWGSVWVGRTIHWETELGEINLELETRHSDR